MMSHLKRAVSLIPGWRTQRKIVVIQSDDWFSIRTSSAEALLKLESLGARVDRCHYMRYDHFETEDDLTGLFEVLASVNDQHDRPALITANCLSANPDFDSIKDAGFKAYYPEPSVVTASRIHGAERNMDLWREAIRTKLCEPQSHGREHLNVPRWLEALQSGTDEITLAAFNYRMFGVSAHIVPELRGSFQAAFDTSGVNKIYNHEPIVREALVGFEKMFDFRSRSFISPNYVWSDPIETMLATNGVQYIQSSRAQLYPSEYRQTRRVRRRFLGAENQLGQRYLVRNVEFEPSSNPALDWQDYALRQINLAFRLRKPAVITTHRVNYIGRLNSANRDRGLRDLREVLRNTVRRWPEVEFMSTTELGDVVSQATGS